MVQVVQPALVLNTKAEEYVLPAQVLLLIVHHVPLAVLAHYVRIRSPFSQRPTALAIAAST